MSSANVKRADDSSRQLGSCGGAIPSPSLAGIWKRSDRVEREGRGAVAKGSTEGTILCDRWGSLVWALGAAIACVELSVMLLAK